ncbi:choline kinase [Rhizobium sp. rho-13.1]|uniref:phosphotransferase n=1 Tax=Rhizobium sp. B230/85 TaxID=2819994 RepID=UPI00115F11A3|nr:phosphotransferase [Rhizobium sp. B230/85]MBO9131909.1 phosphotransferase [Rhizobium sp. B209b/85]MBO9169547.1 phosphotransferase [Rhizobium sp. L245/93]TQX92324.1 choline kinase [Rhizobium sp. rho-13.1]TQY18171.1 choline kinase [Rhizobium sp. rho-1.1]QXZ97904.1 phosphotransferase [Rhizobium sp. B230/85]
MIDKPEDRIRALDIWHGPIEIAALTGGITNRNYLVRDGSRRRVVRLGSDIPVHHIVRANELAASLAAHAAGLSPDVVYHEPGILVLDYIDAPALSAEVLGRPDMLERVVLLVRDAHRRVGGHLRGAAGMFWSFHIIADYASTLRDIGSRYEPLMHGLLDKMRRLEKAAGPFDIVFCHNDLLASNFLDDGHRLWLIDWDYAGFNTPLFDLGGLASNAGFSADQEAAMLDIYHDGVGERGLKRRYEAMKCASLLRETLWSMVSEAYSTIEFDYVAYTADNMARFERAYQLFDIEERR